MKETARFTVTITDNLKGDVTKVNTNVMCASIKNFDGDGAFICNLAHANGADVLTTVMTALNAIKTLCETTDHIASYKGILQLELEMLKGEAKSKWLS